MRESQAVYSRIRIFCFLVFGRLFANRFALCHRTVVLSCLHVCPVCNVRVLWPSGWTIKMKHGMQVGLGPGRIVLDGDSSPSPPKGYSPLIFGQYLLRPNGWIDQDATWYGGRPRRRRLF